MGCGSSASAYEYQDGSPVKPVRIRMAIKRRESFVQANTILVNRVAERLHEEWKITRTLDSTHINSETSTIQPIFEPYIEIVGQAKVDIANLSWEDLPESVKARKLALASVCSNAVIEKLRDQNVSDNVETKTQIGQRRKTISLEPSFLDSIAELEYVLEEEINQLPWNVLTASERSHHYTTILCVISEWNEMMQEAEKTTINAMPTGTTATTSTTTSTTGRNQNISSMLSSNNTKFSPNSDNLSALGSVHSMTSLSTQELGRVSPLSNASPSSCSSNGSPSRPRLTRTTFARSSSRGLTRVLSGRDILQEIRQTIRVRSASEGAGGGEKGGSNQHRYLGARQRMKWAALRIAESTRAHLRKQIRKNKHFVRVFVSSTFRDFHAERDYLFQRVFPRLESACAERGILFIPVDLRWGVTTQEALDGEVIKLCLQEVDTCRPFFVAMLGERYGWHVDPSSNQQSSGDTLLKETFEVASITFPWVKKWRDRSATEIEIRHAVLNNPKQKMHSFFFLRDPTSPIVKTNNNHDNDNEKKNNTDATKSTEIDNTFQAESAHAKMLQNQLKDSIRDIESKQHHVTDGYKTLEELGKTMFEQLQSAIEFETSKTDMASIVAKALGNEPLDAAHASRTETERLVYLRNEAVAQGFRHAYVKDQQLFTRVEQMCGNSNDSDSTPLVIVGGPGLGKSALLANLTESSAPQLRDTVCVILYIGGQYQSPTISEVVVDVVHLVRRAVQRLRDSRNKKNHFRTKSEPPASSNQTKAKGSSSVLRRKASSAVLGPKEHQQPITETDALESPLDLLNKLFEEASHELRQMNKRLLIGLDGVDRISDDSITPMAWLPVATPVGVQLVLSLATGEKSMEQSSDVAALGTRNSYIPKAFTTIDQKSSSMSSTNSTNNSNINSDSKSSDTSTSSYSTFQHSPKNPKLLSAMSPHVILGRRVTRMLKIISTRKWNIVEVTPLTPERGQQLVTTYLNLYGKKFDQNQMKLILKAKHTENPLYMITLLNEIRKFGSFENLGKQLNLYLKAEDTTSLFSLVLQRLDDEIGSNIVSTAARVIWVARSGVSEYDLKTILSKETLIKEETYDDFRHRTRDIFINRANLISFVHFSLADAVEDTYLNESHEINDARNIFVTALEVQANNTLKQQEELHKKRSNGGTIIPKQSSTVSAKGEEKGNDKNEKEQKNQEEENQEKANDNNQNQNENENQNTNNEHKGKDNTTAKEDWNHDHALKGDWWYYIRELAYQYSMLKDWNSLSSIIGNLANFVLFTEFDPELLIRYWRQLRLQHIKPNTVYKDSFDIYSKEQAMKSCDKLEKITVIDDNTKNVDVIDTNENNKSINKTKKNMRRQSTVPSRRRSLAGIDIEMLLLDPLSKGGQILVHQLNYKMILEVELNLIDDERDVLLKLERFFQMLGEYRIALEYSKSALNLMNKVPKVFFGVIEVSSMLIEMAQLEHKLHEFENAMEHLNNALSHVTTFLKNHPDDVDVRRMHIVILGDIANLFKETGRYDDALIKYDEALIWTTQYLGTNDIECAVHLNNLANLLMEVHRYEDALSKYERSLQITEFHYNNEHPEVARTLHNIGLCLKHLKNYNDAMEHFMTAAKMMVDALGTYHPEVGIVLNNISVLCSLRARNMGKSIHLTDELKTKQKSLYIQAQQAAERSVVIRERSLGSDHPTLVGAYTNLGKIYSLAGNQRLSKHCYERAVEIGTVKLGANHPLVGRGYAQLGRIASKSGDLVNAREKFQRAVASLRVSMGVVHAFTRGVEKNLKNVESKISRRELNIGVIQEE